MASRDLTQTFLKHRDRYRSIGRLESISNSRKSGAFSKIKGALRTPAADGEKGKLLAGHDLEMGEVCGVQPPEWILVVDSVRGDMEVMRRDIDSLKSSHARHLKEMFSVRVDENKAKISQLAASITSRFSSCEARIRGLTSVSTAAGRGGSMHPSERSVRENAKQSLACDLSALSSLFKAEQQAYTRCLRGQEERSKGYAPDVQRFDEVFNESKGFTQQQLEALEDTEEMAEQRARDINKVVSSVGALQGMFKELAVLVIEQGTILDRIDQHTQHARDMTSEAVKELTIARDSQKKGSLMKCIVCLGVLVALLAGVLVLKLTGAFKS
jgi:syntaxin 16